MTKSSRQHSAALNRKLISLAVASCFVGDAVYANPTAPTVVNGVATFQQVGNLLQVTNSPSAIINWGGFSINANEVTRFIQQSAVSAVLNRVVGQDPSAILGALQSNGRVFLVNPNGILFGAGAQIDVAGLVASTLNLSNADFLAGRMRFTEVPGAGSIINDGAITTAQGGSVYLVAPNITNSGIITSPRGEVILAAGKSVELVDPGTPNLRVEIVAAENEARNLGQIVTDSGRIGIYAGLINHGGTLRADTVAVGKNGEILLKANKNINLESGSTISASGAPGGVHDGGSVRIVAEDTLDMQRGSAVHVDGGVDGGNGGFLELSGKRQIALNGEYTGRARKEGYKHGSLLLDPLNIAIGANGIIASLPLVADGRFVKVNAAGSRAYVLSSSSGTTTIEVIDTATSASVGTAAIAPFFVCLSTCAIALPSGMVISPDGTRAYILYRNGGAAIRVVDIQPGSSTENTVIGALNSWSTPTGSASNPNGIAVSSDNTRIYVVHNDFICSTCPSNASLTVIDALSLSVVGSVNIGFNPSAVSVNPVTGRVITASQFPNRLIQEVDVGVPSVPVLLGTTTVTSPVSNISFQPDGSRFYIPQATKIDVYDASRTLVDTLPLGATDVTVASGATAYFANNTSVSVIDLATKTVLQTFQSGVSGSPSFAYSSAYGRLFSAGQGTNALSVIDLNPGTAATTGGAIAFGSSPGSTLSLPVSALNGAWSSIDLAATNNIGVNAPILNGDLDPGTTLFKLSAGNDININAALGSASGRFNRDITLRAGNNVNVHGSIYQSAGRTLALDGNLTDSGYGMTASGTGSVNIKALGAPVTVDTLGSMTVTGQDFNILGGKNALVSVNVGGLLDANLTGNVLIQAGSARAESGQTANASVSVNANAINIAAAGAITIAGGDNGFANAEGPGTNTANATANTAVTSATTLVLNAGGALTIRGGDNSQAYASSGNNTATMNASATVSAGSGMTLSGASIMIRGGDNASAYASSGNGTATTNANATVSAGGALSLTAAGSIDIRGGDFASATGASVGTSVANVNTNAMVSAPSITLTGGAVTIRGGDSGSASAYGNEANNTSALNANASVSATNNLAVTATSLTVRGGNGNSAEAYNSGTHAATLNANASLSAGGAMTLNISGPALIAGGNFNDAYVSSGNNLATLNANATVSAGTTLTLTAAALTVRGGDSNSASAYSNGNNTATLNANASLTAGQAMNLNISGPVLIAGGDFNSASASSGVNTATLNANATVSAGMALTLSSTQITLRGGDFASASASSTGVNTATANVNATLSAGGNMALTATSLGVTVRGGDFAEAYASNGQPGPNSATTNANATASSGGLLTVNATGGLTVRGGNNAFASVSSSGINTTLVNANASVLGDTINLTVSGPVLIQGGNNVLAEASCCANASTVNTSSVNSNGLVRANNGLTLTVTGGSVTIAGGDNARTSGTEASGQYTTTTNAKGELSTTAGNLTVNVSGGALTVRGGDSASASASASSNLARVTSTTVATGKIAAGGNLSLTAAGGVTIRGGDFASADVDGTSAGTRAIGNTNADAVVGAGGSITVNTTSLDVRGGNNAYARVSDFGQNSAVVTANAYLAAGTDLMLTTTGGISVSGGNNARAMTQFGSSTGTLAASVSAGALVTAGGMATLNAGSLTIAGGMQSSFEVASTSGPGTNTSLTLANANIAVTGDFNYTGGTMTLMGGVARAQGGAGSNAAASAEANAGTQIAGAKTLTISGDLLILGGSAFDDGVDATNGIAMARAILDPGALTIATLGDVMVTGGSFTGQGSAYSTMMAQGPINLTISGSTGLTLTGGAGTAVPTDPSSPVTFVFTGGGTQNIVNNLPLDSASIQTALFISPPPPPALPPPPAGELPVNLELVNQVLIKSVNESGNTSELQPTVSAEGPIDQVEKKKNEVPVCR